MEICSRRHKIPDCIMLVLRILSIFSVKRQSFLFLVPDHLWKWPGSYLFLSSLNVWNTILQWKQGWVISRVPACNSRCCQTFSCSDSFPAPSVTVHQLDESIIMHQSMVGILSGALLFRHDQRLRTFTTWCHVATSQYCHPTFFYRVF